MRIDRQFHSDTEYDSTSRSPKPDGRNRMKRKAIRNTNEKLISASKEVSVGLQIVGAVDDEDEVMVGSPLKSHQVISQPSIDQLSATIPSDVQRPSQSSIGYVTPLETIFTDSPNEPPFLQVENPTFSGQSSSASIPFIPAPKEPSTCRSLSISHQGSRSYLSSNPRYHVHRSLSNQQHVMLNSVDQHTYFNVEGTSDDDDRSDDTETVLNVSEISGEQTFQLINEQLKSQPCEHSHLFNLLNNTLKIQTAAITALTKANTALNAKIEILLDNKMIISGALKRPFERVDSEETLQALDDKAKETEFVQACKTYWTTKFRCWVGDGQSAALNISKDMFCPQFMLKCSWSGISRSRRTDADKDATTEKKIKIRFGKYENVINLVFELANNLDRNFDLKQTITVLSTCTRNSKAKSQQGIRTSAKKTRNCLK